MIRYVFMSLVGLGVAPPCATHGNPIGSFARLDSIVHAHGRRLSFATNGGIFAVGQVPLGLFIQNGRTLVPLNLRDNSRGSSL